MRLFLSLLVVAAVALALWLLWHGQPHEQLADVPPPAVAARPAIRQRARSASCAGRACHGSLEPSNRADGPLFNEYTTWATRDPHARAYDSLLTERSRDMAHRLGIAAAHESERCLACHTTPAAARLPDHVERYAGVGCEACHGNAVHWLDAHTAKSWAGLTAAQKRERGMIAVGEPAARAQRCAGCHVGAPPSDAVPVERDVNHDLLAAGHPRLAFEFSSFMANLPPHWRPGSDPPDQRWAVGQAVAADAALELLRHRASSAHAPWPELAEYDCFACHHDLTAPSWRQQRAGGRRGALSWGTWCFTMPAVIAAEPLPELTALVKLLDKPSSPRTAIAERTRPAIAEMRQLATRFAGRRETPASSRRLMDALLVDRRLVESPSWDAAEQTYLALWALNRVAQDAGYQKTLDALLDVRAYRAGWDSPLSLPKGGFDPAAFVAQMRRHIKQ